MIRTGKPTPIRKDFKKERKMRQEENYIKVYNSLKTNNKKIFYKNINKLAFQRVLERLQLTDEEFFKEVMENEYFCRMSSMHLSKNASRQCSKDEVEQLKICNLTSKNYDIFIQRPESEIRLTKDGQILSKNTIKEKKIEKDCCLKSFDGCILGKFKGFISCKTSFGSGGHQDNVFEEQHKFAEVWAEYRKNDNDILVLLIDTDLNLQFTRLKEKYNHVKNIMVFDHVEFQQYLIDTYHV